jgi:hypothetical protein
MHELGVLLPEQRPNQGWIECVSASVRDQAAPWHVEDHPRFVRLLNLRAHHGQHPVLAGPRAGVGSRDGVLLLYRSEESGDFFVREPVTDRIAVCVAVVETARANRNPSVMGGLYRAVVAHHSSSTYGWLEGSGR